MGANTGTRPAHRPSRREDLIHVAAELFALQPWQAVTVAARSCLVADVAAKAALLLGADGPAWLDARSLSGRFVSHDGHVTHNGFWSARAPETVAA